MAIRNYIISEISVNGEPSPFLKTEGSVEGLSSSIGRESAGSLDGRLASKDGLLGGVARGVEPLADEVADDVDVEGGSLAEVGLVDGTEGGIAAAVETDGELDGRVGAAAEVEGAVLSHLHDLAALDLGEAGLGPAFSLLLATGADATVDFTRVGGVGAGVVLDGTRPLERGTGVQEGGAVDLKGTVSSRADNSRGRATEGAREDLDVDCDGNVGSNLNFTPPQDVNIYLVLKRMYIFNRTYQQPKAGQMPSWRQRHQDFQP